MRKYQAQGVPQGTMLGHADFFNFTVINLYFFFFRVQFVIHEAPGQELEVELYDEDTDKDDFMGRWSYFCDIKWNKKAE